MGRSAKSHVAAHRRFSPTWSDYELIDSGSGRKLERFGQYTLIRPEPQATWRPAKSEQRWHAADATFVRAAGNRKGEWKFFEPLPPRWTMRRNQLEFWVQPTPAGHVGLFPDQACHWDWIAGLVESASPEVRILCLFGHTGLATLAAAAAGAEVTHVDASQKAIKWARENQALSGLTDRPIRWIVEDALKFVTREVKRGHKYDAVMLDPPRFGRGPGGEIWKVEEALPLLLRGCRDLLSETPLFVLLNTYTTVLTQGETAKQSKRLHQYVAELLAGYRAATTSGELVIADSNGRQISASVFARAALVKK